ncbi:G protein-activated inward rectifier potassium channel 4-like [Artemia franciscana]
MAVLYAENEVFHLAVRIGDLAKSRIIGATVTAEIFMKEFDGNRNITVRKPLEVTPEYNCGLFFFLGPLIVIHRLTPSSPLYQMSSEDHRQKDIEIMIIVTGSTEETGAAMQAISSYKHEHICWGYKFEEIAKLNKDKNTFEIDYNNFDILKHVSTSVSPTSSPEGYDFLCKNERDSTLINEKANTIRYSTLIREEKNEEEAQTDEEKAVQAK